MFYAFARHCNLFQMRCEEGHGGIFVSLLAVVMAVAKPSGSGPKVNNVLEDEGLEGSSLLLCKVLYCTVSDL